MKNRGARSHRIRRLACLASAFPLLWIFAGSTNVATASARGEIDIESDVLYATHSGVQLRLDVYLPPGDRPFPAVVVIPGGKWVNIDKEKHADVPMYFAAHGIAAFSIEYRSALKFPYPAAIQDVVSAVRWVRQHAAEYNVDPHQLGAIGVSAGGHLAALVGTMGTGALDEGARVRVVASWSGPMDLRPLVNSRDAELREAVRVFLGCRESESCASVAREASPRIYVDPTDPPMMLVNSVDEIIPVAQAEGMAAELRRVGVESEVRIALGGHGAGYGGGNKVLDLVIPYVQAWIEGRESPTADPPEAAGGEGKGGVDPASATPPSSEDTSKALGDSAGARRTDDSSSGVMLATIVALVVAVVITQLLVIAWVRRRLAGRPGGPSAEPSAEDR